ncbi:DNA-binding response regulator, NarL/FixJ family, contains REC and HTH domains [Actinoplanes philippinensis]|uniref:DNA-binding response regulator, NarL/FixJ family, contains REC and HTH domains n=1 Tax=Actinoplanes philippinensis TaxID=35752 RepID=A0A1I2I456_9ACTN|nr:response regulator transcription factor [Actinoplanes philippinensis]SFF37125.1 DNA-binding response regulator, NarL/FixJ family, contains REC and HTH domains [Actinoplanes philippinensis]
MIADQRVLVVDDHPVVRRGLRAMLEGEPWVATVTEAATVAEAVREAAVHPVHVVAMDVVLPDGDGIDAAGRILRAAPGTRMLILTMDDDESVVERALRAGAHGFLLKDTDPEVVVDSLRTVAAGGVVLGPRTAGALLTGLRTAPARIPAPFDRLSEREREVVVRLTAGDSNAQIARRLGLSEKTVRNQLSAIFAKLGVTDRVRVALLARDAGLRA